MEGDQNLSAENMYGDEGMNIEREGDGPEKMTNTGNMSGDGSVMGTEQGDEQINY